MSETFKDNFWGPSGFEVLEKRMLQGVQANKLFLLFLRERAAIEETYSKSLQKLLKNTNSVVEYGTLRDAWLAVRGEVENVSRVHHDLSGKIEKDIATSFRKAKTEQKKVIREFCHTAYKLNKERKDMENSITKAKFKYEEYSKQATNTSNNLENARGKNPAEVGKLTSRLQRNEKDRDTYDQEYKDAVGKLQSYKPVWEEKTQSIYVQLQQTEEERIDVVKINMDRYVQALSSCAMDQTKENKNLEDLVRKIDKYEDINQFIVENKTGNEPPPVPSANINSSTKETSRSSYSRASMAISSQTINDYASSQKGYTEEEEDTSYGNSSSSYSSNNNNNNSSYSSTSTTSTAPRQFGYMKNSTSSNSLNKSANSTTTSSTYNAGGSAPKSNRYSRAIPPPVTKRVVNNKKTVTALYDYVGSDASELDFLTGDIITILDEDESGWWKGEIEGRQGLFPSNYCQLN